MNSLDNASVLVTGGCGFIGSHLVRSILRKGTRRVIALDSLQYGRIANLADAAEHVEIFPYRLGTDDPAALESNLKGVDYVFHLAAEKHNQSLKDPLSLIRSNVEGTYSLLRSAAQTGVKKVVFTSSLYAYGRRSAPPMRESECVKPDTIYGISKAAGEGLLAIASAQWSLKFNVARLFFIYGPGQFSGSGYKSVIVRNFERIVSGQQPEVRGDGHQALDYLYVDDAVDALIRMLETDLSGETFNVGSGIPITVDQLTELMLSACDSNLSKTYGPPDDTFGTWRVADITKIRDQLGWRPGTSIADGLKRTFRAMRTSA